ncbi:MAG: PilZ domain-containing protein [Myxococcota bacterium]
MSSAAPSRSEQPVVDAVLHLPDGRTAEGQLVDIGAHGVTILCDHRGTPAAEAGSRVRLVLRGAAVGGEHEAAGHVEQDRRVDDLRRISVRYLDQDAFRTLVDGGLGRIFNRRNAYRVRPSPTLPVRVELSGPVRAGREEARVLDLSVTGAAVVVPEERGREAQIGDEVELGLHLATSPRPVVFSAHIRHRTGHDEGIRLGLDLDAFRTVHFDEAQDRLRDYIMRRQREMLRTRHLRPAD